MDFKDKYTNAKDSALPINKDKITLSNEAYAIVELLEMIKDKLERIRL